MNEFPHQTPASPARALILMSQAEEAGCVIDVLAKLGIDAIRCETLIQFCRQLEEGADVLLVSQDLLQNDQERLFLSALSRQPSWSSIPVIVVADEQASNNENAPLFSDIEVNATIVERPLRTRTLASIIKSVVRARRYQYQTRDAVADSERKRRIYETALSNTADFNYIFDLEGRFTYVNPALLKLWQRDLQSTIGRNFFDLGYSEELAARYQREIQQVIQTRQPFKNESFFTSAQGERAYEYIFVPVVGGDGTVQAVAGSTRDITDRLESEKALRKSETRYRTILESVTDGFVAVNSTWEFTYINGAAERLLGRNSKDLSGNVLWQAYPDIVGSEFEHHFQRVKESGSPESVTAFYPGHQRWYEVQTYPADDGLAIYFRDVSDRVRAEDQVRKAAEANAKFRVLFEQAAQFAAILSLDGTLLEINRLSLEACGFERDEVVGRPFWECGWWSRKQEVAERVRNLIAEAAAGRPIRTEVRYFLSTGNERFADLSLTPVTDENRRVIFVAATGSDITDRNGDAERLKISEERFKAAVAATSEILWTNDATGRMTADQPGWETFTGQLPEEYEGYGWSSAVHPDDALPTLDAWNRAVAEQSIFNFEHRVRRHDGVYRHFAVRAVPVKNDAGVIREWVGTHIDVTDRKRGEDSLKESARRFREMADASPAMLWLTDPDGYCTFLSKRWYDFTGQTEAEALGLGWTAATHPEDKENAGTVFLSANSSRSFFQMEYRLKRHDGVYRWAIDVGRPWFSESGDYLGMIGLVFDIHDRKQAEEALKDADRRKDHFLATLAHELRNPLAPISNALQVWSYLENSPDEAKRLREMMDRQVRQLIRLIDDLLDVSRITLSRIELRKERLNLEQVVENALEGIRPFIESLRHELIISMPAEPIYFNGDAGRLIQIVGNLLHNAAKYTGEHGKIWLSLTSTPDAAVITVRDNGPGIPRDQLTSIFEMFMQVDQTLDRAHGGLGIGLTLVKNLVELHGGTVEAKSDGRGSGSEFVVKLPRSETSTSLIPTGLASSAVSPPRKQRILVVDDMKPSANTLAIMLKSLGHEARTAYDGPSALVEARTFNPDVVFSDIAMPGMNGLELARRIRSLAGPQPILVALSGFGQEEDRRRGHDAGFDHYLVKPTSSAMIQEILAAVTSLPHHRTESS